MRLRYNYYEIMKDKYLLLALATAILVGCGNHNNKVEFDSAQNEAISTTVSDSVQWFVYTQPINGYDVSIRACFLDACRITVYLQQGGKCYTVDVPGCYDAFHQDALVDDTIYIKPIIDRPDLMYLDYRTTVSFADVNFDGMDELIICGFPRPNREIGHPLDCEDFYIYRVGCDSLVQLHNVVFDALMMGKCRTEYIFNEQKKTITSIAYHVAGITSTCVYWFKNGEPYKKDFSYDQDGETISYHFNLPQDEKRIKHIEDSIMGYE